MRTRIEGISVAVTVSDPWDFVTVHGSGPFIGKITKISTINPVQGWGKDPAAIIRLDKPLVFKDLEYKYLIASPRLERDEMITFRIARLENGRIPDVWQVNDRGEVVNEDLIGLILYRGIRDIKNHQPPDVRNLSRRQASFQKSLANDVRMLRKYGQDILDGSAKIFEGLKKGDLFDQIPRLRMFE